MKDLFRAGPREVIIMPRGHAAKREKKKPKKKTQATDFLDSPIVASTEVEIVKKKRKPRDEDF